MTILYRTRSDELIDIGGRFFDTRRHGWHAPTAQTDTREATLITPVDAVKWLVQARGGKKLPIGVIGPAAPSEAEARDANDVGRAIAQLGLPMVCGGRGGAMAAASEGAAHVGGLVIGILPSTDWLTANPFVTIPIATGIGEARNAIIASACFALIAVGKGHGTLSEMALGLKMNRLVITMPECQTLDGATACSTVEAAIQVVATHYLGIAP